MACDTACQMEPRYVRELYFQQSILSDAIRLQAGKISMTGGYQCHDCPNTFDGDAFANDATLMFLNGALVNDPAIRFPEPGLATAIYMRPLKWLYMTMGTADADANAHQTGFNTVFHDYFSTFQIGFAPLIPSSRGGLQGAYRFGGWYNT
jgi:carbohydrate-selective porin OprB